MNKNKHRYLHLNFFISVILISIFIISTFLIDARNLHAEEKTQSVNVSRSSLNASDILILRENSYEEYISNYINAPRPKSEIKIPAENFIDTDMDVEILDNYEGSTGKSVKTSDEGFIEWEIYIENEGLYNIGMKYYNIKGKNSAIERELQIDGEIPFAEAGHLVFQRVWTNEHEIQQDNRGNDLVPTQVEYPMWQFAIFRDLSGHYNEPYLFYFTKGKHKIRLYSIREPVVIEYLLLFQVEEPKTYSEVENEYKTANYQPASDVFIKIQGEDALYKSDPTLYPVYDRTSPLTEPYDVSKIRLNTIGSNSASLKWSLPGQWLVWEFEVPEDGLYKIGIKYKQSFIRGIPSCRRLLIDGKVPFKEMDCIEFNYDSDWNMKVLGNDNGPYLFYLSKGKHQIKMEVTVGDLSYILRTAENSVYNLNTAYRQIVMLTGTTPDPFRDYWLEELLPHTINTFKTESEVLYGLSKKLFDLTGHRGSNVAILERLAYELEDFAKNPETIPERLSTFKDNTSALGQWVLDSKQQPLQIDYIIIASPEKDMPKVKAGFFSKVWHEIGAFFASFTEDYSTIGNLYDESRAITVWINSGRDQAQILKQLIDDTFTPVTGIEVNLKQVQGALLQATVAGVGPDVAMEVAEGDPVNYAIRNAVVNLAEFPDFEEVKKRFRESALLPFTFRDGVYALPERQTFPMLFYRKDTLSELNLKVPKTWEELYSILPDIQKHNLSIGLPFTAVGVTAGTGGGGMLTFGMLLYQRDGSFYKEDGVASALDSEEAIAAFKQWTEFYSNYKLPLNFNAANRFRTGEMPLVIADYTLYNQLVVFAPELNGLWGFAPVPGTLQEDGTIRHDVPGSVTACMMLKSAKDKEAAWEFMKWWTSTETQVRFGLEMESLMGAAARHPTANIEALKQLPWPTKDYNNLMEQWQWVKGIPQVPGGYYTSRHLENAFRKVINEGDDVRETLLDYVRVINDEIKAKRKEFGLDE
ncbi:MAG TPA: extracellular solute-binding protein [Clostridiaceae bacterium]|nr:extracellular solute-binding protein [Clostridiaceae bacterium]